MPKRDSFLGFNRTLASLRVRRRFTATGTLGAALAMLFFGCSTGGSNFASSQGSSISSCPNGGTIKGVDVSHSNGKVDWMEAKSEGIQFVFVKATEGTTFVDPNFHTNWAGLKAAGIVRGAYHYFHPNMSASDQAQFVVDTVGQLEANDLPIVCDFEELNGVPSSDAVAAAIEFMNDVTNLTGKPTIVYTFPKFLSSYGELVNYPLWAASYGHSCPTLPPGFTAWDFWQTADQGSVANIDSTVDQDEFNGTLDQLLAYANRSGGDGGVVSIGSSSGGDDGGSSSDGVGDDASRGGGGDSNDAGGDQGADVRAQGSNAQGATQGATQDATQGATQGATQDATQGVTQGATQDTTQGTQGALQGATQCAQGMSPKRHRHAHSPAKKNTWVRLFRWLSGS